MQHAPLDGLDLSTAEVGFLVGQASGGSRPAFGELYRRYAGMVYAIAMAELEGGDAEDVVQEVFLRAMRQLPALRKPEAFGGWLATITRNAARDVHRGNRLVGDTTDDDTPVRENQHDEAEARVALEAIRSLPPAYRETLMMRLVQGMTGPEIAERTGLTPASVRVNLHRGMKMLRQRIGLPAAVT